MCVCVLFLPRIFMRADVADIPIMALVEEALPGAHCSPATARRLWQSHVQQQMRFVRGATRTAPTAAQRKVSNIVLVVVLKGALLLLVGKLLIVNNDFFYETGQLLQDLVLGVEDLY